MGGRLSFGQSRENFKNIRYHEKRNGKFTCCLNPVTRILKLNPNCSLRKETLVITFPNILFG